MLSVSRNVKKTKRNRNIQISKRLRNVLNHHGETITGSQSYGKFKIIAWCDLALECCAPDRGMWGDFFIFLGCGPLRLFR
jgi:hypothetical protein